MSKTVGVIVPVYGTEKYVARCIESILMQTYTNFHLIIIDDASPDNAGKICDEYAKTDSRITVIHQDNTGVNRARANGVTTAEDCDYITFVDSDDTITPDALDILVAAMSPEVDIAISYRVLNIPDYPPIRKEQITVKEYRQGLLFQRISCAPWGKLFRRKLFKDYTFDIPRDIVVGEDLLMNIRLTCNTDKLVNVIHSDIYNYNIYEGNTTKRFVSSPSFECLWHKLIIASIPEEKEKDDFIRFSIQRRLRQYERFGGLELNNKALVATDFYQDLKKDIQKCKYTFRSFRVKVLFYSTNMPLRGITIKSKQYWNTIKKFFKHPDDELWHAAKKDIKKYRTSPNRLEEGYFRLVPAQLQKDKKKQVICIYDSNVRSGGWADRLRGILSVYHICRQYNMEFKILFEHPFALERYLIPNKVNWGIKRNELDFNLSTTDLCFVSTRTGRDYEMRKQRQWFKKEFKKGFNEFHVRTNAAFSYQEDFSQLFCELFRPSPLLEELLNQQKRILGKDFISVSFRFLDLLGDFNETFGRGVLTSEEKRQKLISKCFKQIELLHEKHPTAKILVNSDSTTFLKAANILEYTYVIPGKISHIDSPEQVKDDVHDKTFTDFFMIANAKSIYLVIADQMYDSGFPYAASRLYDRPFHRIIC